MNLRKKNNTGVVSTQAQPTTKIAGQNKMTPRNKSRSHSAAAKIAIRFSGEMNQRNQ